MAGLELWTYICKVFREPGHNSKACKKTREHNVKESEPVEDESVHYKPVQDEPVYNATQESRANVPRSSQTSTQSDITQAQTGRPPRSIFARQSLRPPTSAISIRAPPPIFGSVYGIFFKPPTKAAMRPPTLFFNQEKKFAKMKDLSKSRNLFFCDLHYLFMFLNSLDYLSFWLNHLTYGNIFISDITSCLLLHKM
ncbi:hypothetical protein LIER_13724 [Lithospermum erythrorhizon]|uniref:Uncharacterized protein n=1 Tax=Lithospermum erythrorhizon TaxID=34254 RepID=A0AAV3PZP0_LITER